MKTPFVPIIEKTPMISTTEMPDLFQTSMISARLKIKVLLHNEICTI